MEAEQTRQKGKRFFGTQPNKNPSTGLMEKQLGLVRANPWADFVVITDQI